MINEGILGNLQQPHELPRPTIQFHVWGLLGWNENPLVHLENSCDVYRVGHVYRPNVRRYTLPRVSSAEKGHLFSQFGACVA